MRDRNASIGVADIATLAWDKMDGLLPAVVQDETTGQVLMLGYMSREALARTLDTSLVTFYSRSQNRLWQKGETSGNHLAVKSVATDCDGDALLIQAEPSGPVCHLGTTGCFSEKGAGGVGFLGFLARIVHERGQGDNPTSYTARLLSDGLGRIAQKVGEEGVEVALAAVARDKHECIEEMADLIYHLIVLMEAKGFGWAEVAVKLEERHR